jgi:hypothetical protein
MAMGKELGPNNQMAPITFSIDYPGQQSLATVQEDPREDL